MSSDPLLVSLPIADRRTSHRFYSDGLGLEAIGEPAEDGVPEPLQFILNDGARIMLIPAGGFCWVIGDHEVAPAGRSECILSLTAESQTAVRERIERAAEAGATIVEAPTEHDWGYTGTFADPDGHLWMIETGLAPD